MKNTTFENVKVLIVEDNKDFGLLLKIMLEQIGFQHILICNKYPEAISLLNPHSIDVFIIDIELGGNKDGVALAEEIRQLGINVPIIYMTSHYTDEYYSYARPTRPSSFLSKELSSLKLHQAIDLALLTNEIEAISPQNGKTKQTLHLSPYNFYFRIGDAYKAIPITDIHYFYADKKMSFAKIGTRSYPTSVQLKTLEEELPAGQFIRIHKSYIINTKFIESIIPGESSVTINGEHLPIGYAFRKEFMAALRLLK